MPLGLHVGALGRPSWPQVGSKTGLATQFLTKNGFSKKQKKTQWFFNVFAPSDSAENDPRSTQDAPKTVLKSYVFDVQNYDRFWFVLGSILGRPCGSQKVTKNHSNSCPRTRAPPRRLKEPPRGPKRAPRGCQGAPGGPQERPQEAPSGLRGNPREPQETPRGTRKPPR